MASIGYIQVRAFTSRAQIPLKNVTISITDVNGNAIAFRLTNRSGQLDSPVEIDVPDISAGLSPNTGIIPFSIVNLSARSENYELINIERLQIFPNTVTVQNLELIPLAEMPNDPNKSERFDTSTQNL